MAGGIFSSHVVMETRKSQDLPSARWRTKKAGGIIQAESEGPETRSSDVSGQEKTDVPAQEERENSPFL